MPPALYFRYIETHIEAPRSLQKTMRSYPMMGRALIKLVIPRKLELWQRRGSGHDGSLSKHLARPKAVFAAKLRF